MSRPPPELLHRAEHHTVSLLLHLTSPHPPSRPAVPGLTLFSFFSFQFTFTSLNCPCLQELVDVYAEYPFFVQDHGWSSCSPQRTARLCGLQCRQLSVGDVCLALTPLSAPQRPLRADPRPEATPTISEQAQESPRAPQSYFPPGPGQPAGEQRKEQIRRRHRSAPELRGGGAEEAEGAS